MEVLAHYSFTDIVWISLGLMLSAMNKGGIPVGVIATPLLILIWPDQTHSARMAVGFMLPMLCLMDIIAVIVYRRYIEWPRLTPLWLGGLAGVVIGSVLFVSDDTSLLAVSDKVMKLSIGCLGLLFVLYYAFKRFILSSMDQALTPNIKTGTIFGLTAGLTSTLAHAAAPVMQMYLLPQKLPKKIYVGTNGAFFFVMNLLKLLPFAYLGRISKESLVLGGMLTPVLPVGVALGWWLTHIIDQKYYIFLIYVTLSVTSFLLIVNS